LVTAVTEESILIVFHVLGGLHKTRGPSCFFSNITHQFCR